MVLTEITHLVALLYGLERLEDLDQLVLGGSVSHDELVICCRVIWQVGVARLQSLKMCKEVDRGKGEADDGDGTKKKTSASMRGVRLCVDFHIRGERRTPHAARCIFDQSVSSSSHNPSLPIDMKSTFPRCASRSRVLFNCLSSMS